MVKIHIKETQDPNSILVEALYLIDPCLQKLGKLKKIRFDENGKRGEAIVSVIKLVDYMRNSGLDIQFRSEQEIFELTKSKTNLATLMGGTVYVSENLRHPRDANRLISELGHEYGAYKLSKIYGGKDRIPRVFPEDCKEMRATHYLDLLCWEE